MHGRRWAPKILSVGSDLCLLNARHELLVSKGYDADYALPYEAEDKLLAEKFDVLILSATVPRWDKQRIRAAVGPKTNVLDLYTLVWPEELLDMIENGG